jgi:hypothetical protein
VIDEINRLSGSKSGGASKMLNFFVQLTNSIGVPVVLVGTHKAKLALSGEFHQIRRGTGQGDLVWNRMEEGEWVAPDSKTASPGVWQLLLESFWRYQYTRIHCPLTNELSHVLYEETQGITDFAAKVYMLAQIRAMVTAHTPDAEVLTADIIRSVARDSLKQAQRVLAALRQGDHAYLDTVPDINPIRIDDFISRAQTEFAKNQSSVAPNNPVADLSGSEIPYGETSPSAHQKTDSTKPKAKRRKKGDKSVYVAGDLRAGFSKGKDEITLEALQKAGHISSAIDHINEQEVA